MCCLSYVNLTVLVFLFLSLVILWTKRQKQSKRQIQDNHTEQPTKKPFLNAKETKDEKQSKTKSEDRQAQESNLSADTGNTNQNDIKLPHEVDPNQNPDWQKGKSLPESLYTVHSCQKWCDISFRCRDQDEMSDPVGAHKMILAARSSVFEAMFFGMLMETQDEIALDDIDSETFKLFLRFLYVDKVKLSSETAKDILMIAHKYNVSKCVDYCAKVMRDHMDEDNVFAVLELALFLDLKDLTSDALYYIDINAKIVFQSEAFKNIDLETLKLIIDNDYIFIKEVQIMEGLDKWAVAKCEKEGLEPSGENKRKVLGDVFNMIRFPTMTPKEFMEATYKKGYFSEEMEQILADITNVKHMEIDKFKGCRRIRSYLCNGCKEYVDKSDGESDSSCGDSHC